jgi:Protein of unknown function (DUF3085)
MSRLVFKAEDLRRIVTHALAAPSHSVGYGGVKGDVILVHDHGVYLMSAGQPRDLISEGGVSSYVAYAEGCDPVKDSAWWETARELVGGDDFGQHFPWAKAIGAAIDAGATTVAIDIAQESISLVSFRSKSCLGERAS